MTRPSHGKINLLLNLLGRRSDGFHELETVLHPIPWTDELAVERTGTELKLTCNQPALPVDAGNLVHRAATVFLDRAGIREGVSIHLEKRLPLESGLGGGSSNAATTLLALNELFGSPLELGVLVKLAAALGSDVPFFLRSGPAIGTGRGERIEPLDPFSALQGLGIFLIHPGFGISTVWAYKQMSRFPSEAQGQPGRAQRLVERLRTGDLAGAGAEFYNSLEAPALAKYPILRMYQDFLRKHRPIGLLMSGSGSSTFSLWSSALAARQAEQSFRTEFGDTGWTAVGCL